MPDRNAHEVRGGRRSWSSYAAILRSVHDGIDTAAELAPLHGLRSENARDILRRMNFLGLLHVVGQVQRSNGVASPRWSLDKPAVPVVLTTNKPLQPGVELIAFATMLRALRSAPQSVKSLCALSGVNRNRAAEFINFCHTELHCVHVVGWRKGRVVGGGSFAALYSWGFDKPDVPRPQPEPEQVMNARYRARRRVRLQQQAQMRALSAMSSVFRLAA